MFLHEIEGIEVTPPEEDTYSDGRPYYSRSVRIKTVDGGIVLHLFSDEMDKLKLKGES
jgi:hypothetical protein